MSGGPQTPSPAPHAESRANSNRKQEQNRTSGPGCDAGSKRVITAKSFYGHLTASAIASHPLDGPERKARQPLCAIGRTASRLRRNWRDSGAATRAAPPKPNSDGRPEPPAASANPLQKKPANEASLERKSNAPPS
jgi:hypothetical protein